MDLDQIRGITIFLKDHGALGLAVLLAAVASASPWTRRLLGAAAQYMRHRIERPVPEIPLTLRRIDEKIEEALRVLLLRHDADRAYVCEYDEYDPRIKPLPWVYHTCTFEVVCDGRRVNAVKHECVRQPLSISRRWLEVMATAGEMALDDIAALQAEDPELFRILQGQNISGIVHFGLHDFHGLPIGFLGLDYCNGRPVKIRRVEDKRSFQFEALKIAGLLTFKKNGSLEKLAGKL